MKRASDIFLSFLLTVLFFPVFMLTAVAVLVSLGRPIIFTQMRAGKGGREFRLLKWRSMSDATDEAGRLLPDEQRTTAVGHAIRRLRVDELPSVINIIRGDLSFVGPRPLPLVSPINQAWGGARLKIRPGLTGLAQVSGNTQLSDEEKLAVDLYYVATQSYFGDLLIIWRTALTVIGGERRDEPLIRRAVRNLEKRI
jgi:lipopolysaccharide/colanic/teichoic acid biosynthesis glycosyltransferase